MGLFLVLIIIGIVVFLVLRGRRDRQEALGTPSRGMPSGPVPGQTFANPYAKCPTCGAAGDKMRQAWDGMRKVTWTCGYCGAVAGIQELKDEELPASARQRLGLDGGQGMVPGQPYYPQQGGAGGLLTGMMIGSMLGGERRYRNDDGGWVGGGGGDASSGPGNDWGEHDNSGGGGGGDWGDSGGGDSGGGDSGGGSDF
jgi:hypothetical protein